MTTLFSAFSRYRPVVVALAMCLLVVTAAADIPELRYQAPERQLVAQAWPAPIATADAPSDASGCATANLPQPDEAQASPAKQKPDSASSQRKNVGAIRFIGGFAWRGVSEIAKGSYRYAAKPFVATASYPLRHPKKSARTLYRWTW